jgi:hypothetical protein
MTVFDQTKLFTVIKIGYLSLKQDPDWIHIHYSAIAWIRILPNVWIWIRIWKHCSEIMHPPVNSTKELDELPVECGM